MNFGPWDDYQGALKRYGELISGQTDSPATSSDGITVRKLCNHWLDHQKGKVDNGELSPVTFDDYLKVAKRLVDVFGPTRTVDSLRSNDFSNLRQRIARQHKSLGVQRKEITSTKSVFKFGVRAELINDPRYGVGFDAPRKRNIDKQRKEKERQNGTKVFTVEEIRLILHSANPAMRAMTLLGINCAVGPEDIRLMTVDDFDFERGWMDYARRKTSADRRARLWPETVEAIKAYLKERPEPKLKEHRDLLFITRHGNPYGSKEYDSETKKLKQNTPVTQQFGKLLCKLGIKRSGQNHYTLRHTFRTTARNLVADDWAIDLVMGHHNDSMAAQYTHDVRDDRLEKVADALHGWLFASTKKKTAKKKAKSKSKSKRKAG